MTQANREKKREAYRKWYSANAESARAYGRKYYHANADKSRAKWLSRYGLTPETYDIAAAGQGQVCAICKTPETDRRLSVDHDHATGTVRGLLCRRCNTALGLMSDAPDVLRAAIAYLENNGHIKD